MSENEEAVESVKPRSGASWIVALIVGAIVLLILFAGVFAMRDRLLAESRETARTQNAEREKLAARIDQLQTNIDNASSQSKPNDEAITNLNAKLTDVSAKLDALNARVESLEKKPEPMPVAAAPAPAPAAATPVASPAPMTDSASLKLAALSGKPFALELAAWQKLHPDAKQEAAALSAVAESGIMTEAELNQKLREALDIAINAQKVDDTSLAGKINTHLAGLVSIKKSTENGPYTNLRRDVMRSDSVTLIREVEGLDTLTRAPLEAWLKMAHARNDAIATLNALDIKAGQ